jgi:hypothetical protein
MFAKTDIADSLDETSFGGLHQEFFCDISQNLFLCRC